ncbi:hypothetical protein [Vampirovibrio chlorellavorus]|uniref:hypothetical protein n=1 Tax=Vampirovibrio chlorellavorus TaxID=758823 RepID=UPI0026EB16C2|nr:hypothetical protein [Vampirovibrio chlorellavorus]
MSFIGPNFRPPGQSSYQSRGPAQGEGLQSTGGPAHPEGVSPGNYTRPAGSALPAGTLPLAALMAGNLPLPAEDLARLLRNLFQLPKDMIQLLALLSEQEPAVGQALLEALAQEEAKVPLEALQDFLQGRVDTAQQKLLKLLQGNPSAMAGLGDVGTLMQGLGELADKIRQGPQGTLDATVTLYLPFYPLHPPQAFTLRFETPEEGAEGRSESVEPQLVVYVETLTLGAFRAVILPDADKPAGHWQAVMSHEAAAGPYLQAIETGLQEAASGSMPIRLLFAPNASERNAQGGKGDPVTTEAASSQGSVNQRSINQPASDGGGSAGRQSVGLHPAGGVSVLAIQVAYLLIRVILELDNRNALLNAGSA